MAYATPQDLADRFGVVELQLFCDRDGDGEPDEPVIRQLLADADAAIDRHLGGRYQLPLSTVDASLTRIACDLARYWYQGDSVKTDGPVALSYKQAWTALRDLATGVTVLQAEGVPAPQARGGGVGFVPGGGAFDLQGYP